MAEEAAQVNTNAASAESAPVEPVAAATTEPAAPTAEPTAEPTKSPFEEGEAAAEPKAEETPKAEDKPAEPEVPESYDIKLKEGFELSEGTMTEMQELFKEAKVTQETAQKLADFHQKVIEDAVAKDEQAATQQIEGWRKEWAKNPNLEAIKMQRNAALNHAGEEFKKLINSEPLLGDNPVINNALALFGKLLSEPAVVAGEKGATERSPQKVLWNNMA